MVTVHGLTVILVVLVETLINPCQYSLLMVFRERIKYIVEDNQVIAFLNEETVSAHKYKKEGREYRYGYVYLHLPPEWIGKRVVVLAMTEDAFDRLMLLAEKEGLKWVTREYLGRVAESRKIGEPPPPPPGMPIPVAIQILRQCEIKCIELSGEEHKKCVAKCFDEATGEKSQP